MREGLEVGDDLISQDHRDWKRFYSNCTLAGDENTHGFDGVGYLAWHSKHCILHIKKRPSTPAILIYSNRQARQKT